MGASIQKKSPTGLILIPGEGQTLASGVADRHLLAECRKETSSVPGLKKSYGNKQFKPKNFKFPRKLHRGNQNVFDENLDDLAADASPTLQSSPCTSADGHVSAKFH